MSYSSRYLSNHPPTLHLIPRKSSVPVSTDGETDKTDSGADFYPGREAGLPQRDDIPERSKWRSREICCVNMPVSE